MMNRIKIHAPIIFLMIAVMMGLGSGNLFAENIDPNNDDSQFAYGENVGWLNAEPSGDGGPGVQVDDYDITGYIWAENIGWISLSCLNAGSCGTVDYGVDNDSTGNLSGFAWSENAGWINFNPTGGGVTIDPATGIFSGMAWGENIGWVTFSSVGPVVYQVQTAWIPAGPTCALGDLDCDGDIDGVDRNILRGALRTCNGDAGYNADADYDDDGCITFGDYRIWYGYYKNQ